MSMKHFNAYYQDLQENYNEMLNGLRELEQACSTGMVEPERVERYMKTLQPIKDSFLTIQYIKYLLDKPNKKVKQKKYDKQFSKSIDIEKDEKIPEQNGVLLKELK